MPVQIVNSIDGTTTARYLTNNQDIGYLPSTSLVSPETPSSASGNIVVPPGLPSDAQLATTHSGPSIDYEDAMGRPFARPSIMGQDPISINF